MHRNECTSGLAGPAARAWKQGIAPPASVACTTSTEREYPCVPPHVSRRTSLIHQVNSCKKALQTLPHVISITSQQEKCYYFSHFGDEKTKAYRMLINLPSVPCCKRQRPEPDPGIPDLRAKRFILHQPTGLQFIFAQFMQNSN